MDAFDVFADNLCNPDKGIRVPTLRILCHYEPQGCQMSAIDQPPEKKMKTEFSETCPEDSQSIDVCISKVLPLIIWLPTLILWQLLFELTGSSTSSLDRGNYTFNIYQQESCPIDL